MFRVLSNLIKNALEQIEINQKGEITIWSEDGGDVNRIHIKDTAGGAPPNVMDDLFTGFKTTKKDGTGVGLAFCKKTLHSFGADITAHSVYGHSMEFVLTFPKI
jgi:signal transduction histidine kinase